MKLQQEEEDHQGETACKTGNNNSTEKLDQANTDALTHLQTALAAEKERPESAEKLEKTKREIMIMVWYRTQQ
jgi:hypothetical protein